jgi:hypothetical protein
MTMEGKGFLKQVDAFFEAAFKCCGGRSTKGAFLVEGGVSIFLE